MSKSAEATLSASLLENEASKAQNADLIKSENDRRSAHADKSIADAVRRGAIAAKDEETKKGWKALILADLGNATLLDKAAGNPALTYGRIADPGNGAHRRHRI